VDRADRRRSILASRWRENLNLNLRGGSTRRRLRAMLTLRGFSKFPQGGQNAYDMSYLSFHLAPWQLGRWGLINRLIKSICISACLCSVRFRVREPRLIRAIQPDFEALENVGGSLDNRIRDGERVGLIGISVATAVRHEIKKSRSGSRPCMETTTQVST
jgi:hypothetical protein